MSFPNLLIRDFSIKDKLFEIFKLRLDCILTSQCKSLEHSGDECSIWILYNLLKCAVSMEL